MGGAARRADRAAPFADPLPEENAIGRVFWRRYEAITRNQGFLTIEELVDDSMSRMEEEGAA